MSQNKLQDRLREISHMLYQELDELLPKPEGLHEDVLAEAIRYSTLFGGKRIRPFLTCECCLLLGVSKESAIRVAAAIEMIHSYSLIHDDLPGIDNDDTRRGKESCHKKYGEAVAILAGDALLTEAFAVLAAPQTHPDPSVRIDLISALSAASGFFGMVGGQMLDILSKEHEFEYSEAIRLQRLKTGCLFAISCEAGGILGKAPRNLRSSLKSYANSIGLAFQITDDILDSAENNKCSLIAHLGKEKALEHVKFLANQAIEQLSVFDERADLLRELALMIATRKS